MNPTAELRDIHLPAEVAQWPPAYGWWVLAALGLALLVTLIWVWIRRRRLRLARRQALEALKQINVSDANWPVVLNQLLKRLAISYFPRHQVAALHTQQWIDFMSGQLTQKKRAHFEAVFTQLNQALYQPDNAEVQFDACMTQAKLWIASVTPQDPRLLTRETAHV